MESRRIPSVTPNLFEAWQLSGVSPIRTIKDIKEAAKKVHELGAKSVVVKGGKQMAYDKLIDLSYYGNKFVLLEGEKHHTTYNHGASCVPAVFLNKVISDFCSLIFISDRSPPFLINFSK